MFAEGSGGALDLLLQLGLIVAAFVQLGFTGCQRLLQHRALGGDVVDSATGLLQARPKFRERGLINAAALADFVGLSRSSNRLTFSEDSSLIKSSAGIASERFGSSERKVSFGIVGDVLSSGDEAGADL